MASSQIWKSDYVKLRGRVIYRPHKEKHSQ